jgi:hypothetical protein
MICSCSASFAREDASWSAMSFVRRVLLMELSEFTVEEVDISLALVCVDAPLI